MDRKLERNGYITFFLSGICAISTGIIVSILQDKYGFNYGMTGTLLSLFSIGNMAASFLSGILPSKIGAKRTVLVLCSGYVIGYAMMAFWGAIGALLAAFLLVGLAKGCALNNCTVLVGQNAPDRTKGMNLMHACYATGAMLCPFLVAALLLVNNTLPMLGLAAVGLLLWLIFSCTGFPEREGKEKGEGRPDFSFMKDKTFWLLTALIFCQNAAETSVTGWLVTYYKNEEILSGSLSTYTVTIMWGATLIARLLIAFVFPIKNTFKALTIMGIGCTCMYGLLVVAHQPLFAILALFAFAFAMAGVNPVAVAGVGKMMNTTSMGVMLPLGSIGAILMPWIIGMVAEHVSLQAGMITNIIPCLGIFVLSLILLKLAKKPIIMG